MGDISRKEVLEAFAAYVLERHEKVDYIVNNALPQMKGIDGGMTRQMIYHGDHGWSLNE